MNSNGVADIVGTYLTTKHSRIYRAKAPKERVYPYVVYRIESVMDTYPSHDFYLNVDIYEDPNKSVRAVEDLADAIETGINHKVIIENGVNLQFEKEQRQSIDAQDLLGTYLVNIRFVVRGYFI